MAKPLKLTDVVLESTEDFGDAEMNKFAVICEDEDGKTFSGIEHWRQAEKGPILVGEIVVGEIENLGKRKKLRINWRETNQFRNDGGESAFGSGPNGASSGTPTVQKSQDNNAYLEAELRKRTSIHAQQALTASNVAADNRATVTGEPVGLDKRLEGATRILNWLEDAAS